MPQYFSNGHLQFILYGKHALNQGALVHLQKTTIFLPGFEASVLSDITVIRDEKDLSLPYELESTAEKRKIFWENSLFSPAMGWVYTGNSVYDKTTRILRSDDKAHYRSRQIDADGVGVDAYQRRSFIHIRSNVRMTLQPSLFSQTVDLNKVIDNKERKSEK